MLITEIKLSDFVWDTKNLLQTGTCHSNFRGRKPVWRSIDYARVVTAGSLGQDLTRKSPKQATSAPGLATHWTVTSHRKMCNRSSFSIGSGDGFLRYLPDDTKPLSEPNIDSSTCHMFEDYTFKIIAASARGQWVDLLTASLIINPTLAL